jgi:hypothetical protein
LCSQSHAVFHESSFDEFQTSEDVRHVLGFGYRRSRRYDHFLVVFFVFFRVAATQPGSSRFSFATRSNLFLHFVDPGIFLEADYERETALCD